MRTNKVVRVSVVIPAHSVDRWDSTVQAIASLAGQTRAPWEIIVAVGGSPELARRLEERFPEGIRVVQDAGGSGPARVRNLGARAAAGDVIAFLEDDAAADPRWLEKLVSHYADERVQAVGGRAVPGWEGRRPWWLPEELYWVVGCTYRGHPTGTAKVRSLPGCNMSFRRQVFEKLGYFSLNFGRPGNFVGAEDTEMFLRLHRRVPGAGIVYDHQAVVHHRVPRFRQTLRYLVRRSLGEGIGRARLSVLYPGMLTSERSLLGYFVRWSIPSRLAAAARMENPAGQLGQLAVIALSVLVTGAGFGVTSAIVRLKSRRDPAGSQFIPGWNEVE